LDALPTLTLKPPSLLYLRDVCLATANLSQ